MSDITVNWITVARSGLRHRLRLFALTVTVGLTFALALTLLTRLQLLATLVGTCAAVATALMSRANDAATGHHSWCIDREGRVLVRARGAERACEAVAAFASSFLIVLRHDGRTLEVWRDATPAAAFRRLAAAVRWRVVRGASVVDFGHAADRT